MKNFAFGAVALMMVAGAAVAQDDLARWTFESSVPTTGGPFAAEAGVYAASSFATGFHADPSVVYSNPVGNGSGESFSSNFWTAGDYYQFTGSTIGYTDITIGFDQTRSGTGPADFSLYYSIDGSNFNLVTSYVVDQVTWSFGTHQPGAVFGPFSLPGDAANQSELTFRLVSDLTPGNTGGTNRVDNAFIAGTAIPTPGAVALFGAAGLVAARRRRTA